MAVLSSTVIRTPVPLVRARVFHTGGSRETAPLNYEPWLQPMKERVRIGAPGDESFEVRNGHWFILIIQLHLNVAKCRLELGQRAG